MKEKAEEMMGLKVGYPSLHTGFSMYKHCPGSEARHETSDMEGQVHGLKGSQLLKKQQQRVLAVVVQQSKKVLDLEKTS